MIEDFFRHKCDIYTGTVTEEPGTYGLPNKKNKVTYPENPTSIDVSCFFAYDDESPIENTPKVSYRGANQLSLPAGTVVKQNDKVIDKRYGLEYTLGFPEDIRGVYISVPLYRKSSQEAL